jgi:hypothetical protein
LWVETVVLNKRLERNVSQKPSRYVMVSKLKSLGITAFQASITRKPWNNAQNEKVKIPTNTTTTLIKTLSVISVLLE